MRFEIQKGQTHKQMKMTHPSSVAEAEAVAGNMMNNMKYVHYADILSDSKHKQCPAPERVWWAEAATVDVLHNDSPQATSSQCQAVLTHPELPTARNPHILPAHDAHVTSQKNNANHGILPIDI